MKYRIRYVSNSSTSSFLAYGYSVEVSNKREFEQLVNTCKHKVFCILSGYGTSGDADRFALVVTPERLRYMKKHHVGLFDEMYDYDPDIFIIIEDWRKRDRTKETITVSKTLEGGHFESFEFDSSSPETDAIDDKKFVEWVKFREGVKKEDLAFERETGMTTHKKKKLLSMELVGK